MSIVSQIMHIGDQLGLANAGVFGQENPEFGQGKVSEKSGNFFRKFYLAVLCGNPVVGIFSYRLVTANYMY